MKNEAIEVLMNRRCVRKYKAAQITDAELQTVLDAGSYAPTARNMQRPFVVALQNRQRDAVAALSGRMRGIDADPYYGAPTVIVVLAPADEFGPLDASAVETNMLNAAYACGLSACWIHCPPGMFATEEGKALLRAWNLDEALVGVCSVALGYGDCDQPAAAPRKTDYYRVIR